ncbi:MAG: DUF3126 family protein [Pseudomonadota bacterium]
MTRWPSAALRAHGPTAYVVTALTLAVSSASEFCLQRARASAAAGPPGERSSSPPHADSEIPIRASIALPAPLNAPLKAVRRIAGAASLLKKLDEFQLHTDNRRKIVYRTFSRSKACLPRSGPARRPAGSPHVAGRDRQWMRTDTCCEHSSDAKRIANYGARAMHASEILKLQAYFREKFNSPGIAVRGRDNKDDSVEVYLEDEFIGVIFKDEEDGDLAYQFNMAILDIDLPELKS